MRKKYFLLGIFFLMIQIITIFRNYYLDFLFFFWICDFIPLLLSTAFFLGDEDFVKGLVNIGLIPQVVYIASAIALVFFGFTSFEGVRLILDGGKFFSIVGIILHTSTLVAFLFTYKTKTTTKSLYYSLSIILLIYSVIVLFTDPSNNINYVFILSNRFGYWFLSSLWIPSIFLLVVFPTWIIQKLAGEAIKNNQEKKLIKI